MDFEENNYIIPKKVVTNFHFWEGICKKALESELAMQRTYARTYGEEGEFALSYLAKQLFDLEINFDTKQVRKLGNE